LPGIKNIFIEEATNITRKDFEQINLRLRGQYKYYKQISLACNPVDKSSWVYKSFIQEAQYSPAGIYNTTFKDNPFVGDDYEYRLKDTCKNDPNLMDVYYKGLWGSKASDKIFTNWRVDESISQNFADYERAYAAVDFGWVDPCVLIASSLVEDRVYVFKEFYKNRITIQQFADVIKEIVPRYVLTIADARSPGLIQELKNNDIYIRPSDKTPNSVIAGINFLKSKEIIIHPSCTNLIEELQGYSYMFDDRIDELVDKPTQGKEHCVDALRYSQDMNRLKRNVRAGIKIF